MDGRESNRSVTSGRLHHQHPQRVKNHTSWQVKKKNNEGFSVEVPSSLFSYGEIVSVFSFFFFVFSFFLKSAPWGEGLQGRAACGPIRTVHSRGIPHSGRYKDKMAARRMRAELSRTTEVWHRLTEFTSLRAGSGDSWPTPSGGKEIKVIIRMQSKNIRNEMKLLCWNDGGIWHREQDRSRSPAEPLCKRQTDIQTWYTANLESCPQNPEFVGALY